MNGYDENLSPNTLPCDTDAEYAICAAVMYSPDLYGAAAEIVTPADFFDDGARAMFKHSVICEIKTGFCCKLYFRNIRFIWTNPLHFFLYLI